MELKKAMFKAAFRTCFQIIRHNWGTLLLVTACTYWPMELLRAYVEYTFLDPGNLRSSIQITRLLDQFFYIIPDAAIYYIGFAHLAGEKSNFGESLCHAFASYGRMWVTRFLVYLSFLSLLLLVFPGVYWLTRWSMSEPNVMYEGNIGVTAFGRSWSMTRRKFWRVFRAVLGGWAIYSALECAIIGASLFVKTDNWCLSGLLSILSSLLVAPWLLYICAVYAQLAREEETDNAANAALQASSVQQQTP